MLVKYYLGCVLPLMYLVMVYFDAGLLLIIPAALFFIGMPVLDPLIGKNFDNLHPGQISHRMNYLLELAPVVYMFLYMLHLRWCLVSHRDARMVRACRLRADAWYGRRSQLQCNS